MRCKLVVVALAALAGTACGAADKRVCSPIMSWSAPAYSCKAPAVAEPAPEPEPPAAEPEPAPEPEPEPERVVVKEGTIEISEVVQFETNSAVLLPQSEQLLDEVAKAMNDHPEVLQVQIEGHTDSQSSDAYNLRLSRERANSVRKYLISRGVDDKRLTAKGFGESKPIADNETEDGRYKNRRVEFKILKRAEAQK